MSYAQSLIDDFSIPDKAPHIAISVDMLDTGIDVPEVVNLVFFKLVRSKSKFWQMIGRGTRLCPNLFGPGQDKTNFYVFDFCGNLEYFSQNLPTSEGSLQKSLNQRLFETRVGLVTTLDSAVKPNGADPAEGHGTESERGLRVDTAWSLHKVVVGMNLDNVLVRPHRRLVEQYAQWPSWSTLTEEAAGEVAENLAGLPSGGLDRDEQAKRFDLLILRRQLAQLQGDALAAEQLRDKVQNIASALLTKTTIPSVAAQQVLLDEVAGDDLVDRRHIADARAGPAAAALTAAVPRHPREEPCLHRLPRRAVRVDARRSSRHHPRHQLGTLPRQSLRLPQASTRTTSRCSGCAATNH